MYRTRTDAFLVVLPRQPNNGAKEGGGDPLPAVLTSVQLDQQIAVAGRSVGLFADSLRLLFWRTNPFVQVVLSRICLVAS